MVKITHKMATIIHKMLFQVGYKHIQKMISLTVLGNPKTVPVVPLKSAKVPNYENQKDGDSCTDDDFSGNTHAHIYSQAKLCINQCVMSYSLIRW